MIRKPRRGKKKKTTNTRSKTEYRGKKTRAFKHNGGGGERGKKIPTTMQKRH